MTGFNINHNHTFSELAKLDRFFVGYDRMLQKMFDLQDQVLKVPNYPPYNIKKTGDNTYVIEMAVAGFGKSDIEITIEDSKLIINGRLSVDNDENVLYKGISNREFTRTFTLADTVEVRSADLLNGMLKVWLENIIPEHKKPRKIHIDETSTKPTSTFLTEVK